MPGTSPLARIVVITHAYDRFIEQAGPEAPQQSRYLLFGVLREMADRGHDVKVAVGPSTVEDGDLAILHTDCSVTPPDYLALAERFPRCVNGRVRDITKRVTSGALLAPGDDWSGPVIVKSNLNAKGFPETQQNIAAKKRGQPAPHPEAPFLMQYKIYDSPAALPEMAWSSPHLVVEKFIPEPADEGFAMRVWVFMGPRERCTRYLAKDRMIKAEDIVDREAIEVPEALREVRERLGFDFGKFDFVMHEGRAVLLDANKTPGTARAVDKVVKAGTQNLANGLEALLP